MKRKLQAILTAGGIGKRLQSRVPKPFILLRGRPLFIYALQVFDRCPEVTSVILVGHKKFLPRFRNMVKRYRMAKVKKVIAGGATRSRSVAQGMRALDPDTDVVLVHDAARPFLTQNMVRRVVRACQGRHGAIAAVPVKSTIKRTGKTFWIQETLKRSELWEAQTPQVFPRKVLETAYQLVRDHKATDDAGLVEKSGNKVKVVFGDYRNLKITTPEDVRMAVQLSNFTRK